MVTHFVPTYLVTNRVAISLIHETSRAKRRRSIIFIFLLTVHSAWFVHGLRQDARPVLSSFSSFFPCSFSTEISMLARRRVHPKSSSVLLPPMETHQDAPRNPWNSSLSMAAWPHGNDTNDSFLVAKWTSPRPISFYATQPSWIQTVATVSAAAMFPRFVNIFGENRKNALTGPWLPEFGDAEC